MNIDLSHVSDSRKRLAVEVPASDVNAVFAETVRDARKQVRVPGFRPGKAPLEMIKARLGAGLKEQVAETLVERYVPEAIQREDLSPLPGGVFLDLEEGQKDPSPAVEGEAYAFAILVDVVPGFELGDYAGLSIPRPAVEVDDERIDKELQGLRDAMGHMHDVEGRPSQLEDWVEVEIEGAEPDGEVELERKEQLIRLGAEGNLPAFNDNLSGLNAGEEFAFDVAYPDDFPSDSLKGRTVHFEGVVKAVKERHLPELSDELAQKAAGVETLAELRDKVRESVVQREERQADDTAKRALLDKLIEEHVFDAPASLVEREVEQRLESIGRNLQMQGVDPREAEIDWEKVIEDEKVAAAKSVRGELILDRIAQKEGLDVEPSEVDRAIEALAYEAGQKPDEVRARLHKSGGLPQLRQQVLRRKTLEFVFGKTELSS